MKNIFTASELKIAVFVLIATLAGFLGNFDSKNLNNDENKVAINKAVELDKEVKYSLKTISYEELLSLPRIGPKRAKDILLYRKNHGLTNVADLVKIKGIGKKTLAKLKPFFIENELPAKPLPKFISKEKINLNTAGINELTKIKGIGIKKAQTIVNYRILKGKFLTWDDVLKVKGIGPSLLMKIKKNAYIKE